MIPPRAQWCHQICVTSMCWPRDPKTGKFSQCSNCTRLLGHERKRYFMTPDQFEVCAEVAKDFPYKSEPHRTHPRKVIGIFGGEPLLHPNFPEFVDILCSKIPDPCHRGLWTSLDWPTYKNPKWGAAAPHVMRLLNVKSGAHSREEHPDTGFCNWNMHEPETLIEHQPLLVSISDVIADESQRWRLINACWVQQEWSAAYALNHKGEARFYFCEVASSFDRILGLDIGIAVEQGVWRLDLDFEEDAGGLLRPVGKFAQQITAACQRCGASLPMKGRRDREWRDDMSLSNIRDFAIAGSPMVERGDFVPFDSFEYDQEHARRDGWVPNVYVKKGLPIRR
jgi:hypothetical protein